MTTPEEARRRGERRIPRRTFWGRSVPGAVGSSRNPLHFREDFNHWEPVAGNLLLTEKFEHEEPKIGGLSFSESFDS